MEIKKEEIPSYLVTIIGYDDKNIPVSGLLTEKISLKSKRKLQSFRELLLKEYNQYQKDYSEILKAKEIDDLIDIQKEYESLLNEIISLPDLDVSREEIEKIETSNNYDWKIIEKLTI